MREYVFADFENIVGTVFNVPLEDGAFYPLTLIEATTLPAGLWSGEKRAPFQLKFKGPGEIGYLPQGIHVLHHPVAGECPMGLVPVGREPESFLYQAIFN